MTYGKIEIDNKHLSILKSYLDELWDNQHEKEFHSIYFKATEFIDKLIEECSEYQACDYCAARRLWNEKFKKVCSECVKTINFSCELKL